MTYPSQPPEPPFVPGYINEDPCDTNHPGPHSPEVCIHTTYDHDACCYLPQGCLGGCTQPGGCMDPDPVTRARY
jgi:hypothetical protein